MRAFAHPDEALHDPQFFLTKGVVRSNFEIPARAASLRAGLAALGITPDIPAHASLADAARLHSKDYLEFLSTASAQWSALADSGPEVVANMHPTPEMLAQSTTQVSHIIAQAGRYSADAACPIGPQTWAASLSALGLSLIHI
jgi:acetoin utilization deacetylase AcuC-like enzyme